MALSSIYYYIRRVPAEEEERIESYNTLNVLKDMVIVFEAFLDVI